MSSSGTALALVYTLSSLALAQTSPSTTYTNSYSFTRSVVEARVDCPTILKPRTRIIGRIANGPVLSELTFDSWYFAPEVETALVRMRASLQAAEPSSIIRNVHRASEERDGGLIERVIPPFETRAIGFTRRETTGPATIFVGTFGSETQPCQDFTGSRPVSIYETTLKAPIVPFGCPMRGTPLTISPGARNIDTLTHVHVDLHKAITTSPQRLRTDTYEIVAEALPDKVEPKDSDVLVTTISNRDPDDTLFMAVNARKNAAVCVNVYTSSPSGDLVGCCSCPIAPESTVILSAANDFFHNLNSRPASLTIKLHATISSDRFCRNGASNNWTSSPGLDAWGTTIDEPGYRRNNQSSFSRATAKPGELEQLAQRCATLSTENRIQPGVCRSCRQGAADGGGLGYCSVGQ